ncbi:Hypothetical_protein [Hexamita inflata]|uniref:Hypothetical_protein n=1 Tax=Hexamita inflata TaxID=28002 RepID=A0AA86PJT6_9EUKA|nr:Hypothetical protein HINF_LOCUS28482 [Hexamita inflata]CAI9940844.1 Hypothetical protein HINF_LOCUS28489 [Hexamita inflata]
MIFSQQAASKQCQYFEFNSYLSKSKLQTQTGILRICLRESKNQLQPASLQMNKNCTNQSEEKPEAAQFSEQIIDIQNSGEFLRKSNVKTMAGLKRLNLNSGASNRTGLCTPVVNHRVSQFYGTSIAELHIDQMNSE